MRKPRVAVLTNVPSPYQVELFNAIERSGRLDLRVWYCAERSERRLWAPPPLNHDHVIASGRKFETATGEYYIDPSPAWQIVRWRPDLAVYVMYTLPTVQLGMWAA